MQVGLRLGGGPVLDQALVRVDVLEVTLVFYETACQRCEPTPQRQIGVVTLCHDTYKNMLSRARMRALMDLCKCPSAGG